MIESCLTRDERRSTRRCELFNPKFSKWKDGMESRVRLSSFSLLIFLLSLFTPVGAQHAGRKKIARNPSARPPKVRFISGSSSLKIPFELSINLILVQARVNDSAPLWFILDTGASSTVIDSQLAKALRLKPSGRFVETGGAGTATALIFKGNSIRLPNVKAVNLTISGLPIDFLSAPLGRKISGVLGNDILKQMVVEVDYVSQVINLYEPDSYQYSGSGEVIPLTLEGDLPFVRARVALAGLPIIGGKFELDSGSTGAVLFNTPFVDRNRLLDAVSRTSQSRLGGVGGTALVFSGRLKEMRVGSFHLENSVARFSRARRGDDASARYDGLIGGEIFRRFKVVFDLSRRRVMLEPSAQFAEPFEVDMSGLDLATEGEDFSVVVVNEIEKGSPAAEAGIQEEDVLTAIDGRSAREFSLAQIRQMFMQDGKEYLITLKRGEKEVQTKLKLRRLM